LHTDIELRFSQDEPGAEPIYAAGWDALGHRLVKEGQGKVFERGGTASVNVACPHCFVSVTTAAEKGVSDDHLIRRGFNPAYKLLKHEHSMLERDASCGHGSPS
jgi:hypothetical protein